MECFRRSGAPGFPESTPRVIDAAPPPPNAAEPITRDDLMERPSRHAGVDLHQAGACPKWNLRYLQCPQAQVGHKEVRPLTLARAAEEAGRKVNKGIQRQSARDTECRNRLLRFVQEV